MTVCLQVLQGGWRSDFTHLGTPPPAMELMGTLWGSRSGPVPHHAASSSLLGFYRYFFFFPIGKKCSLISLLFFKPEHKVFQILT